MLSRLRQFIEKKSGWTLSAPAELSLLFGSQPLASGISVSRETALTCTAVQSAVRLISEAVACLPISIYRVGADGSREEARDHPVFPLLRRQWNDFTGSYDGFRDATVDLLCNDHGALVWVNKLDGQPRELIRFLPGVYSVTYDLATGEPTFRLSTADSGGRLLPPDQVINPRVFGGPFGKCPLTLAREAIGLALLMEQHAARLFSRGGRPSGTLNVKGKLSKDAAERIRAAWDTAHGGSESGRTAVLEESTEWKSISLNSVDAQFLELRQFQILEIARAFRVSPHLLFELGRVTYANIESLGREFLVFCLQPILRTWESALTRALLTSDERSQYEICFDEDDLTQASLLDRSQAYSSLISSRVINPNQARKWEGLEPYREGETYLNPNVTPGEPPAAPSKPRAVA